MPRIHTLVLKKLIFKFGTQCINIKLMHHYIIS